MKRSKDLVCGAELDKEDVAARQDFEGKTYEFCSEECKDNFAENPGKFVK